ncbi:hypothetical protein B0T19DRAFT_457509 [Cercophora scortea]|uniref:Uncharacterized protein n=1 Tax=Cercophora scortea TaxID=314031 RepID=A0AAE0MI81_9PEZI|nr:hypothetical protein B0T19DRAFT_457509 [Cercophora scortea]
MPSIYSLSTELVWMVTNGLDSARGKSAFARTCKRFLEATNNRLYRFNRDQQASSAVFWAVQKDERLPTLQFLHGMGFDIRGTAGCFSFVPAQRPELLGKSEKFNWEFSPLDLAVFSGQLQTTAWLLDHGVPLVNSPDGGAHNLCYCRDEPMSPFSRRYDLSPVDTRRHFPRWCPVHLALCGPNYNPEIVKLLCDTGALFRVDHGRIRKAINTAAANNRTEALKYLLRLANWINSDHTAVVIPRPTSILSPYSVWHYAASNMEDFSALRLLLSLRESPAWPDEYFIPPLAYAMQNGYFGAALILAEHEKTATSLVKESMGSAPPLNTLPGRHSYFIHPHDINQRMGGFFPRLPTDSADCPRQKALWYSQKRAFYMRMIRMVQREDIDNSWLLFAKTAMETLGHIVSVDGCYPHWYKGSDPAKQSHYSSGPPKSKEYSLSTYRARKSTS